MRSILIVVGMFVVGTGVGCADLLGIQPWEDKPIGGSSSGGGEGGTSDHTSSTSTNSGGIDPCRDGVQNGAETGVDCGGGTCEPCRDSYGCKNDSDCLSGYCPESRGYCITDDGRSMCGVVDPDNPSCGDCVKNAVETDIDCGGDCSPCRAGKVCTNDTECWSNSCLDGACALGAPKTRCFTNTDCSSGMCVGALLMSDCAFDSCCE